jgi:hypothetical protein
MTKKRLTKSRNLVDIWHYFLGYYRYWIFYNNKLRWMMRNHIHEQIQYRIRWMDVDCYSEGSCKLCGCATTALQMANKSCDKPCYPPMMNADQWRRFSVNQSVVCINEQCWEQEYQQFGKPKLLNDKSKVHVTEKFY